MSSKSLHIPDTWEGLKQGVFPGGFSPDGSVYFFPKITSLPSRSDGKKSERKKRHWLISVQLATADGKTIPFNRQDILAQPVPALPGMVGVITSNSWYDGGDLRKGVVPTLVAEGKNLGKANQTNCITQALREALGLYNKQLKGGGVSERPGEAATAATAAAAASSFPPAKICSPRPLPMLVKKLDETKDARLTPEVFQKGVTVQRKLNGVRMVACIEKGPATVAAAATAAAVPRVVLYSRTSGEYPGMQKIREQVGGILSLAPAAWATMCTNLKYNPLRLLAKAVKAGRIGSYLESETAPRVFLDGELYKHGKKLNWISGESRSADGGDELEYWVFDAFFPELDCLPDDVAESIGLKGGVPSQIRQKFLDTLFDQFCTIYRPSAAGGIGRFRLVRVENFYILPPVQAGGVMPDVQVRNLAKRFVCEGFEGAIARKDDRPYRHGDNNYHSSNLVKIKPIHDAEFPVIGFTQGTRGKDVGAVIWICCVPAAQSRTGNIEQFNVVPKNVSYKQRKHIFNALQDVVAPGTTRFDRDFKGRLLTVEFPELSAKTGIPTQAKALAFRTYEPGPGYEPVDPQARLFTEHPMS